jgi:hypothetical protein
MDLFIYKFILCCIIFLSCFQNSIFKIQSSCIIGDISIYYFIYLFVIIIIFPYTNLGFTDSQDSIIFGDGNQGKVKGLGKIAISDVSVFRRSDGSLAFKGVLDGKLYLVDFAKEEASLDACLITKTSMG